MTLLHLLCCGLIIHFIFLFSIFDIYFKSPIVPGITPEPNTVTPLGKRVVLISVDGLRVDSLFYTDPGTGKYIAEYVQNIIKIRGSWGVSQSHVPTESRPGHVAMLAGFYEDPSAVTKGWKENPVDFDSIFNRSHCSFAWGSPDILNIFFKGLNHSCAFMESYAYEQNFAGDTREYDNWVYKKLQEFMKFSRQSTSLYDEGIFFFLHLLGQDTSGHSDKPHTEKYKQNLKNVDKLVEKIENLFYDFYGDDKTTYILTADHGMTNWGSHGAGDFDEINTPFVAWGAGIKTPSMSPKQFNIEQADITPLLAILLGSSIPVNSVGVLPILYLNMSRRQIAEATLLNAKQIVIQYLQVMENTDKNIIPLFYIPFEKLSKEDLSFKIWAINNAIKSEKFTEAIVSSKELIGLGLEGLKYYQNYYQKPLLLCISVSYLGWILYLLLKLFEPEYQTRAQNSCRLKFGFGLLGFVTCILVTVQKLPFFYYAYGLLPEIIWYFTFRKVWELQPVIENLNKKKCIQFFFCIMFGVELLVCSFIYRWFLCFSIAGILVWSIFSLKFTDNKILIFFWLITGCALGLFSLLPTVGGQPKPLLTTSSGIGLCFLSFTIFWCDNQENFLLFFSRFSALALSIWNNYVVHSHFNQNQELLTLNQYLSWFLLFLSFILILLGERDIFKKLHQIFMGLSIPFVLLSISHEGFFLCFLFIHLFCWIFIESLAKNQDHNISDFRIAYIFLAYIFISFFGLGNTSSMNSFDPAWVRCFITVFSPFLMSALILFKTIIPFLLVSCTMRTITLILNIHSGRLFIIVLIYCNIMGLNFLFLVKNKGSWLDIGTSISHYVIQQVTVVFLVLLFGIAKVITTFSFGRREREEVLKDNKTRFKCNQDKVLFLPTFYKFKDHNL